MGKAQRLRQRQFQRENRQAAAIEKQLRQRLFLAIARCYHARRLAAEQVSFPKTKDPTQAKVSIMSGAITAKANAGVTITEKEIAEFREMIY